MTEEQRNSFDRFEHIFEILLSKIKKEIPPPAHEITEESKISAYEAKNYCRDELTQLKRIMGYYEPQIIDKR